MGHGQGQDLATQAVTWGLVVLLCFWMCSEVSPGCLCLFFPSAFFGLCEWGARTGKGSSGPSERKSWPWVRVWKYGSRSITMHLCGVCLLLRASFQRHVQLCGGGRHARTTHIWKSSRGTGHHWKILEVSVQRRGYQLALMQRGTLHCVSARFYRRFTVLLNSIWIEAPCFIIKGSLWIRRLSNKLSKMASG